MFPVGGRDDRLPDKAWVFGLRVDDDAVAFDLESLQEVGLLNTRVGRQPAVLVVGAGRAVRAFDRGAQQFSWQPGAPPHTILVDAEGSEWRVTDIGLQRVSGAGFLPRLPGHLAYWFGWYAFFPDTELWTGEGR